VAAELSPVKAVFLEVEGCAKLGPFPDCGTPEANYERGLIRLDFPARPESSLPPYSLSYEAGGFSQVNPEQNQEMIATMLSWLAGMKISRAADLFCGLGNFSFPLALAGIQVVGADLQRSTIRSAKGNAMALGLSNCSFIQASAEDAARQLAESGERFDLVILDPPRRGCLEIIPHLDRLAAPVLLYISCDPATLARDLTRLLEQGYQVRRLRLIDMFPQTAHLETMILLSR
jgi:23S rRNA (uracil1939-C5)-methyltransferase